MLSLIISTIVFFIASWYIKRYLEEQEIPKGLTRGMLIFTLSAALAWGTTALINWAQSRIKGPQASQTPSNMPRR